MMTRDVHDLLIAFAPYIAAIISAAVAYLSYRESKRKSRHDEVHGMYEDMKKERDEARAEADTFRKELDEIKKRKE